MKKSLKLILGTLLLGAAALNLAIDSNGNVTFEGTKAYAAQTTTEEKGKYELLKVECTHPDTGETYATAKGCFQGNEKECNPTSCPPAPPTDPVD
jgi:hypothetical protein